MKSRNFLNQLIKSILKVNNKLTFWGRACHDLNLVTVANGRDRAIPPTAPQVSGANRILLLTQSFIIPLTLSMTPNNDAIVASIDRGNFAIQIPRDVFTIPVWNCKFSTRPAIKSFQSCAAFQMWVFVDCDLSISKYSEDMETVKYKKRLENKHNVDLNLSQYMALMDLEMRNAPFYTDLMMTKNEGFFGNPWMDLEWCNFLPLLSSLQITQKSCVDFWSKYAELRRVWLVRFTIQ